MMRTYTAKKGTRFIYNKSLDGDTSLTNISDIDGKKYALIVDISDLLEFAAEYVRAKKIAKLEDAKPLEILMGD